jgi:hypothetical protein
MAYAGHSTYQVNVEASLHPQVMVDVGWLVHTLDQMSNESRR